MQGTFQLIVAGSPTERETFSETDDWDESLERLIARFASVQITELGSETELRVDGTDEAGVFGFGLSLNNLVFLSSIGASLSLNVVVNAPPPPPDYQHKTSGRFAKFHLIGGSETLSVAQLAELAGAEPDESWSVGDPFVLGSKERFRKYNMWSLTETAAGEGNTWAEAIQRLVDRIDPIRSSIVALSNVVDLSFLVFLTENTHAFTFQLSAKHLSFFTNVRAELDMSIVASAE